MHGLNQRILSRVLILGCFLLSLFTPNFSLTSVFGLSISTELTISASQGIVKENDVIIFFIWVYHEYDPVSTGIVRVTDLNTSEYISGILLDGELQLTWLVNSTNPLGTHFFQGEFFSSGDYLSSVNYCEVIFEEYLPGDYRSTSTSLSLNSSVVYKNASLTITIEVIIPYSWFFKDGYVFVRNLNLSGNPVIHTYGPLPYIAGSDPTTYNFSFDYIFPIFTPLGINFILAEYTGSDQSMTQPSTSPLIPVTVMSNGFTLSQTLNSSMLQRNIDQLELTTIILGDHPFGLVLRSFYQTSQVFEFARNLVSSRTITNLFNPNSSVPIGNLQIMTELLDPSNNHVYANVSSYIDIVDQIRIEYVTNSSEFRQGETVRFSIYATEDDIHTHPVECRIELFDITDDYSIVNKSTNQDGFVTIEYVIPQNATVGSHHFAFHTHSLIPYLMNTTKSFILIVKGNTIFDLTYETSIARNSLTIIQVTVLSGAMALSEGQISLTFLNGSIIQTKNCTPGVEIEYQIPLSHPLGISPYVVLYSGSQRYDSHIEYFYLTIFSNPHFENIGCNTSEVVKGQTIRLWGQLVDELGTKLINEIITITDTTSGSTLGSNITNEEGIFLFDYVITGSAQIGLHLIEFKYNGNPVKLFYSSINKPILSFTVRPPLSIFIDSEIVGGKWTVILLAGGLSDLVNLSWQISGESVWTPISSIKLNATGFGSYNWSVPTLYKGPITIRAVGPFNTKYDYSEIWMIPQITIQASTNGNVNNPFYFKVTCNEQFQIWITNQLWKDWQPAGVYNYSYTFSSRGIKTLKVISTAPFVYDHEKTLSITVFEELFLSLSVPSETYVNLSTNIDGIVIGEVSGPIPNQDIILEINGTNTQVDSSSDSGAFYFSVLFSTPGIYYIRVKTNLSSTNYYSQSTSSVFIIIIHSVPSNVIILSPLNQIYGSIIEIALSGNANNYSYFIEPIDSLNSTWMKTTYRSLGQGDYTLHVFGFNQDGMITYEFVSFSVDTTSPSLALLSPTNCTYGEKNVHIKYLTDENIVELFLDGEIIGYNEMELTLDDGSYNLTVKVSDPAGNYVIKRAYFSIDTIPPSLKVYSPHNQSYTGEILISFSTNGTTILWNIIGVHTYNQTYNQPISLVLSFGSYELQVWAFDEARNFKTKKIIFSIVEAIELLLNPTLTKINETGGYLIQAEVVANPDFAQAGVLINGSMISILHWSSFYQNYRASIVLPTPGIWEITIFACTVNNKYDLRLYNLEWNPLDPILDTISINYQGSFYEFFLRINSYSLPVDQVKLIIDDSIYPLTFEPFWNRWVSNLPLSPNNYTFEILVWYPWDNSQPSGKFFYKSTWYAPNIEIDSFIVSRNSFILELRGFKQNSSINTESVKIILSNSTSEIQGRGVLTYSSLSGLYFDWKIETPDLYPGVWNYSIFIEDITGCVNAYHGLFNNSDYPPQIKSYSINHIPENDRYFEQYWYFAFEIIDDYAVKSITIDINELRFNNPSYNGTHYFFGIYLAQGYYSVIIRVFDDINQECELVLDSLTIFISTTESMSSSYIKESSSNLKSFINNFTNNPLFEIGLSGIIFAITVIGGRLFKRRRRD
ncbi:hypothetical protein [Candidatus Hodarchaeum mangrovi]